MSFEEDAKTFIAYRELDDGRLLAVVPLLFGARLTVGPGGEDYWGGFDDGW